MATLNDLKLGKDVIEHDVDMDQLPEQMGMRPPMLQPGPYIFTLPSAIAMREIWDTIKGEGDVVTGIVAVFRDAGALTIYQAPDPDLNGKPHNNRVSSMKRRRGASESAPRVSDFDYLLQALGDKTLPKTLQGYADALVKHAGQRFGADIELSWFCNDKKPIRVSAEDGTLVVLDGQNGNQLQKGCKTRYYQKNVDREDGKFPARLQCVCGATLFAGENLVRFRAVSQG